VHSLKALISNGQVKQALNPITGQQLKTNELSIYIWVVYYKLRISN